MTRVRRRKARGLRYVADYATRTGLETADPNDRDARHVYAHLRDQLPATRPDVTGAWAGLWQFEPAVPDHWRRPLPQPDRTPPYALLQWRLATDPDAPEVLAARAAWEADIAERQTFLAERGLLADAARDWPHVRPRWWLA